MNNIEQTKQYLIYLAAPLFSRAEQDFNLRIYEFLKDQGYQVFLPQTECAQKPLGEIYQTCLAGLQSSRSVVAILDGAVQIVELALSVAMRLATASLLLASVPTSDYQEIPGALTRCFILALTS
jgi:hypothetical protein